MFVVVSDGKEVAEVYGLTAKMVPCPKLPPVHVGPKSTPSGLDVNGPGVDPSPFWPVKLCRMISVQVPPGVVGAVSWNTVPHPLAP